MLIKLDNNKSYSKHVLNILMRNLFILLIRSPMLVWLLYHIYQLYINMYL